MNTLDQGNRENKMFSASGPGGIQKKAYCCLFGGYVLSLQFTDCYLGIDMFPVQGSTHMLLQPDVTVLMISVLTTKQKGISSALFIHCIQTEAVLFSLSLPLSVR